MYWIIGLNVVVFVMFCVCSYAAEFHPEAWKAWVKRNIVDDYPYSEHHSIGRMD